MTKGDKFDIGIEFLGLLHYGSYGAIGKEYLQERIAKIIRIVHKYSRTHDDFLSMVEYICNSINRVIDNVDFYKVRDIGTILNNLLQFVNEDNVIDVKNVSGEEYKKICNDILGLVNYIYPIIDMVDNIVINDQSLCSVFVKRRSMHFQDSGD